MRARTQILFKNVLPVIGLILTSTICFGAESREGGGSHGGDTLVFEFSGSAQNLARALKAAGPIPGCPIADELEKLVNAPDTHYSSATLVTVQDSTKDIDVDARNWNDENGSHIEISRVRVSQIKDPNLFMTLVLHEFLGLMGVEGTNDRRFSQQCIDGLNGLGKPEFAAKSLMFHLDPVSSIERAFSEGRLFFQCKQADERLFKIRLQEKSFCEGESKYAIALESQSDSGQWTTLGRSGCLSPEVLEHLFFVQYSVQTGEGRFTLNAPDMRQVKALTLSSSDRVSWDVEAFWTHKTGSVKLKGTCSPELVVQ